MQLDATRLAPGLYQGSAPRSAQAVSDAGFGTLVLCAQEVQPPDHVLTGLDVLRCPLVDDPTRPLTQAEWRAALNCSTAVALRLRASRRVLVTCAQGLNRSGLVSALSLILAAGWSPADAVRHIQRRRPAALNNPQFVAALSRMVVDCGTKRSG